MPSVRSAGSLLLFLVVSVVLLLSPAACRKDVKGKSSQDLVSRLDSANESEQHDITMELADRGEAALPDILQAFSKTSKPSSQIALAEAVYRMKKSKQRDSALLKMQESVKDKDAQEVIGRFAADAK